MLKEKICHFIYSFFIERALAILTVQKRVVNSSAIIGEMIMFMSKSIGKNYMKYEKADYETCSLKYNI